MKRFFAFGKPLASALGALAVVALVGAGLIATTHAIDRAARKWSALTVRVAAAEQLAASAYASSIEAQRDLILAEERVLELPEDGNTWHTILLLRSDWQTQPAERRAESIFHSEPLLVSLKAQTHWHCITSDQKEFEKFRPLVDATPCLIVERANGEVVYRESGPKLGSHPRGLCCAIQKEVQRHCPDGRCLPLHPLPGPAPDAPPVNEIPTVLQQEAAEPPKPNLLPAAAIVFVGIVTGIAVKFRRAAAA